MAVLFPTPTNYTLRADKSAELLQGFLNIQNVEGVQNGALTKANLNSYGQKRFFAADPSSAVASYLNTNFNAIAALDGNANSISVDDLVQIRSGLPAPAPITQPPVTNPPVNNGGIQMILVIMVHLLQQMFNVSGSTS